MSRSRLIERLAAVPYWFCIACLLSAAGVGAEVTSGDRLPAAIKDIKPAAGVCLQDDGAREDVGHDSGPQPEPDMRCAIGVTELARLRSETQVNLMDLRPSSDFQASHINGAMNLRPAELRGKSYWRAATAVLLGDGKAERELYVECVRLRQLGYKDVRVLYGGMPQWLAHDEPVIGRAAPLGQLVRLSAVGLWQEAQNPDNLVVLGRGRRAIKDALPFSVELAQASADEIKMVLERRRRELKNAPLVSIVLVAESDISDAQIERLQRALMPVPLLVYADTSERFVTQLSAQKAVWSAHARGPKQPRCGL